MLCKHFYTNHFETPPVSKGSTIIPPSHAAHWVVIHEFAQDPTFGLICERTQIDATFSVASAFQHAAFTCTQGNHVAWSGEIRSDDGRIDELPHRQGAVMCRYARRSA